MSWLSVLYRVRAPDAKVQAIAHALALEQSVELPIEAIHDPFVAQDIVGRVESVRKQDDGVHAVTIRLATETTGLDLAQTLNMLFGNSSLHEHVELADVSLPPDLLARFPGPRFGIDGVRRLCGVAGRPLTCAALKPQGLPVERLAELCYTFAQAGIDVIKDDHGLADQRYSPFAARVVACQQAIERAARATGRRAIYAPSLVGAPSALSSQARIAREAGVRMMLVAPALVGMPAFAELVESTLDVPVLAHPAFAGAARMSPPLVIGKLFRLIGADAVIFPSFGGRFSYSQHTCGEIVRESRAPWAHVKATLPVPAGGITVERVPEVVRFYGNDSMLLVGGSLLAAGERLLERTREFVDLVAKSAERVSVTGPALA
jgi:ribulose-bisphosphate carboxylase large chain